MIKFDVLEGPIKSIKKRRRQLEEILDLCFLSWRGLRTQFSTSKIGPRQKTLRDSMRLGEYPPSLGEFVQNSQESLAMQFCSVWRATIPLKQILEASFPSQLFCCINM